MSRASSTCSCVGPAMLTSPVSSTFILTPVLCVMPRIVLPPGPMTSRIFSGSMLILRMRGAFGDRESGTEISASILSRICIRACFAWDSAFWRISRVMPPALLSIWRAVTPRRVPATLKSMSP